MVINDWRIFQFISGWALPPTPSPVWILRNGYGLQSHNGTQRLLWQPYRPLSTLQSLHLLSWQSPARGQQLPVPQGQAHQVQPQPHGVFSAKPCTRTATASTKSNPNPMGSSLPSPARGQQLPVPQGQAHQVQPQPHGVFSTGSIRNKPVSPGAVWTVSSGPPREDVQMWRGSWEE